MTSPIPAPTGAPGRDLADYTVRYRQLPFEPIQAAFRRRRVLDEVRRLSPRRLLEVGCGEHPLFTDLPDIAATVVEAAADFARGAAGLAQARDPASAPVEVIEGRIEDVADRLGRFDGVVVSCLLHEVDDPQALLAAVRRVCAPGAVLHVNVPNAQSLHRLLAVAMGLIGQAGALSDTQRTMQQRATYDAVSLRDELATAGFEVIDSGTLFVKPFTHAQMQQLVDTGFLTPAMLEGLHRLTEALPALGSELWCNARVRDA